MVPAPYVDHRMFGRCVANVCGFFQMLANTLGNATLDSERDTETERTHGDLNGPSPPSWSWEQIEEILITATKGTCHDTYGSSGSPEAQGDNCELGTLDLHCCNRPASYPYEAC